MAKPGARSDAQLLDAWRSGDADAGRALLDRHYAALDRFFANKLAEGHEDLIQDTFAICVEQRDRIREFRPYLFRVAYNRFQRFLQRKYDAREDQLESRSMWNMAPGPSTMMRNDEAKTRLLEALRELPVNMQVALELKFWEGMKSPEIGSILGVEATTVRTYIRRGGLILKEKVKDLAPSGGET
ncbi:MAG: sigma-70 family RNA polymerase sigma factor [Myxococcota bacterium]